MRYYRLIVFLLYVVGFVIGVVGLSMIPMETWEFLLEHEPWLAAIYGYSLLLAFCGLLVAYWVWQDGEELDRRLLWGAAQEEEDK